MKQFLAKTLLLFSTLLVACLSVSNIETGTQLPITALPSSTTVSAITLEATSAVLLTKTPTPSLTSVMPTVTPSREIVLNKPLIALIEQDTRSVFLVDVSKGLKRQLHTQQGDPINVYAWATDGCELIVGLETGKIVRVSLQGNILREFPIKGQTNTRATGHYAISPTEEWIAYTVGWGLHEFDQYEFQDIEVVATNSNYPSEPFKITTKGGAWEAAWAPDGLHLAFSDYDLEGIQQIYISEPSGIHQIELTRFTDRNAKLTALKWAPDGSKIAFIIKFPEENRSSLAITSVNNNERSTIIAEGVIGVNDFWWQDSVILVADVLPDEKLPNSIGNRAVFWMDATNGHIRDRVNASETPEGVIIFPQPLGNSQRVGFFSYERFYIYDAFTHTFEAKFSKFTDVWSWTAAPESFLGEAMCSP